MRSSEHHQTMTLLALCSSLQVENEIFEFQSAAREYSNFIKFPAKCRALNERLGMTKHAQHVHGIVCVKSSLSGNILTIRVAFLRHALPQFSWSEPKCFEIELFTLAIDALELNDFKLLFRKVF